MPTIRFPTRRPRTELSTAPANPLKKLLCVVIRTQSLPTQRCLRSTGSLASYSENHMLWCQFVFVPRDTLASTGPFVKLMVEHADSNAHPASNKIKFVFMSALRLTTPHTGGAWRVNNESDKADQSINKRILRLHLHDRSFAADRFDINRMIANQPRQKKRLLLFVGGRH